MSAPEHEPCAAIEEAARWLATTPRHQRPRPIVPSLRQRFGLSAAEACEAIREARLIAARAT
jgi:hypothetical protein